MVSGRLPNLYTVNGVTDTLQGWAKRLGVRINTLKKRLDLRARNPQKWTLPRVFDGKIRRMTPSTQGIDPAFKLLASMPAPDWSELDA